MASRKSATITNIDKNYLSFELFWKGWEYYEPITMLLLSELLRDKDVFFDIGANIGYYSICAASERGNLRVIAFEPHPKLFPILQDNARVNGYDITCENALCPPGPAARNFTFTSRI